MKAIYIGEEEFYYEGGKKVFQFKKNHIYQSIKRCHTEWANLTEEEFLKLMNETDVDDEYEESTEGYLIFIDEEGRPVVVDNGYWQKVFYIL
ncbi:hypothetical protein BI004_gp169 [Bacillus phage NotTheCreek]|uniref:Uncharacterized protein n=2 Tax=Wphvirus TaxID=1922327 RepID=A0A222Z1L1_9CAUD|nr:hypothetical protein QLX47_gp171 [Bacillus phage Eyuki]YP_009279339.1 hypothetical protein BIZ89_gp172 [Bacillus phage Kida]YP_009284497.1 hypothetical protein BI004_gp169 [Bacillus phage NotTheCreek]AOZ61792.1 hypothetical protein BJ4_169 [Bacillus phage BJ4]ASR78428.1 hypothetical protein PPISBEST_171 [Bacillus phage PPIsBest]ASR79362.1 hypothetical protein ZAINNY_173 [Bacillus phage Zainny]QDH49444.1 hypothetical protein PHIREBALL_170 [Bacillus phage Phireball]QDH50152.1 hypothetical p